MRKENVLSKGLMWIFDVNSKGLPELIQIYYRYLSAQMAAQEIVFSWQPRGFRCLDGKVRPVSLRYPPDLPPRDCRPRRISLKRVFPGP